MMVRCRPDKWGAGIYCTSGSLGEAWASATQHYYRRVTIIRVVRAPGGLTWAHALQWDCAASIVCDDGSYEVVFGPVGAQR